MNNTYKDKNEQGELIITMNKCNLTNINSKSRSSCTLVNSNTITQACMMLFYCLAQNIKVSQLRVNKKIQSMLNC